MTFVIKRKIDELGRIVLPIDYRHHYNISEGDGVLLSIIDGSIFLSKATETSYGAKIVDSLGRIVIPQTLRNELNIVPKSTILISAEANGMLLTPSTDATDAPNSYVHTHRNDLPAKGDSYEQDYRESNKQYHKMMSAAGNDETFDLIQRLGIMSDIDRRFIELPHIINPIAKVAYDKSLLLLDSWAMMKGGRIKGEVSYERYDAVISVIFPFFEFLPENSLETLCYIATNARSLTFETTDDGHIEMRICFDYFESIGDKNAIIEEEIQKHPEIVEALTASANKERELMLSDPAIYSLLTKAADQVGVTPEEYLDRFEEVWENDPMSIIEIIHNTLRQRTEDADTENNE